MCMSCLLENIVFMIANIHKYTLIVNLHIYFILNEKLKLNVLST